MYAINILTYKLCTEFDVYMKVAANFHANNQFSQYMVLFIYFMLFCFEKKKIFLNP